MYEKRYVTPEKLDYLNARLHNCPFCGGKAHAMVAAGDADILKTWVEVFCTECEAQFPAMAPDSALEYWNRRH